MKSIQNNKIFKNLPSVETKRLILRKLKVSDADDIYEYAKNPEVSRYTIWKRHKSPAVSRGFIKYVLSEYRKGIPESWGMVLKENNKFIGTCGFNKYRPCFKSAEIGYAMSRDYWGKGLMTEAVKAVIGFGFKKLGLHRISANAMPANKGSERVMKKCGMKYEGLQRGAIFAKGKYHNLRVYSILAHEWKKKSK
jgi:ribosomal-protein-alanine N-acetyltransferase